MEQEHGAGAGDTEDGAFTLDNRAYLRQLEADPMHNERVQRDIQETQVSMIVVVAGIILTARALSIISAMLLLPGPPGLLLLSSSTLYSRMGSEEKFDLNQG